MKKVSLFLIASLFSLGVWAQTSPAKTAVTPVATGTETKASKPASSSTTKKNVNKTTSNKKPVHHVTPAQKPVSPAETKDNSKGDKK